MKNEFTDIVNKTMIKLIPNLPNEIIKRQLESTFLGLVTNWGTLLIKDKIYSRWMQLRRSGCQSSITSVDDQNIFIPIRTFQIDLVIDSVLFWESRQVWITFSEFEFFLIEHASGKTTMEEIIQMAGNVYFSPGTDLSVIRNKILNYYNELAGEFLLLYKRFC